MLRSRGQEHRMLNSKKDINNHRKRTDSQKNSLPLTKLNRKNREVSKFSQNQRNHNQNGRVGLRADLEEGKNLKPLRIYQTNRFIALPFWKPDPSGLQFNVAGQVGFCSIQKINLLICELYCLDYRFDKEEVLDWPHHFCLASLMSCSYLSLPLLYSMYSPLMFLRQIFMHSFSVGVSSLCLKESIQVSKHLELK